MDKTFMTNNHDSIMRMRYVFSNASYLHGKMKTLHGTLIPAEFSLVFFFNLSCMQIANQTKISLSTRYSIGLTTWKHI